MDNKATFLGDDERVSRLGADARHSPGSRTVTMCSEAGCPRAASWGPWCREHRKGAQPPPKTDWAPARDFTPDEYARLQRQVEADAVPLFILAMELITRRQVAHMALELEAGQR